MDKSEAGKLGYLKTKTQLDAQRQKQQDAARQRHQETAPVCPHCGTAIPYEKRESQFCNRSCAASYNNRKYPKKPPAKPLRKCKNCGDIVKSSGSVYCGFVCQHVFQHKKKDAQVFAAGVFHPHYKGPKAQKAFLLRHNDHRCSICNRTEWEGQPIPLVMDHIDGNADNNSLDNFRLVCGNCDMQLPTYKNKNKGNGRAWRRKRYAEGKSY